MRYSRCDMLDDFYSVTRIAPREGGFTAEVALNASHSVYAAHFPGNPVTPGVCVLHICKELLESACRKELRLAGAKNIKFLRAINPLQCPEVEFSVDFKVEGPTVTAAATVGRDEEVFVKISAVYDIING